LYRVSVPVFLAALTISGALFAFDHFYLPEANRKQDALRSQIKGKAPQTYLRPDHQWILGKDSRRIYYYNYFDSANNLMAGLTVYELDRGTFQVRRRIAADRAHWDDKLNRWILEEGWIRDFKGSTLSGFTPFTVKDFPELEERPSYFKKEVKTSQQMNYLDLQRYIADLEQSGFDVVPLLVQLHKKFAFPLYAPIMALIGVPFAFSVGRKGALAGIGASMAIAMAYWTVQVLFEKMGNINELPAALAAWIPAAMFGMGGLYLLLKVRT
jgi:lipopolysaccharide export LptBFGC system permease protein LptF